MQKRLIMGIILILLAIATQGKFSSDTVIPQKDKLSVSAINPQKNPKTESKVTRVVDGDTIIVNINNATEKVRLIGVDTPETVDPRKPVQCFGKEASSFTKSLLEGKAVRLKTDPTQGDQDKYGRLLRYVFLEDGTMINKKIIAEGYGHEYTYRIPYHYQTEFKAAEHSARESQKGLWAPDACKKLTKSLN